MLALATETFALLGQEAQILAAAHWDEVEAPLHGAQRYVLDSARYDALEKLGMLHISTARVEDSAAARKAKAPSGICPGALAGYAAFTLVQCPHKANTLLAALDGLYLAPWARGGLSALRLLRHAETVLAGRGVGLVQYSSPASRPCHALYRRIGAQATETIWHKKLEPASQACKEAQTWP